MTDLCQHCGAIDAPCHRHNPHDDRDPRRPAIAYALGVGLLMIAAALAATACLTLWYAA